MLSTVFEPMGRKEITQGMGIEPATSLGLSLWLRLNLRGVSNMIHKGVSLALLGHSADCWPIPPVEQGHTMCGEAGEKSCDDMIQGSR